MPNIETVKLYQSWYESQLKNGIDKKELVMSNFYESNDFKQAQAQNIAPMKQSNDIAAYQSWYNSKRRSGYSMESLTYAQYEKEKNVVAPKYEIATKDNCNPYGITFETLYRPFI